MATNSKILDAIVRHRIAVERAANLEAARTLRVVGENDAEIIAMLRARLPHLTPGSQTARRTVQLVNAIKNSRKALWVKTHQATRSALVAFARIEGDTIQRIADRFITKKTTGVRAIKLRQLVTSEPFSPAANQARNLSQWFGKLAADDQDRLMGALRLGIRNQDTVETMVRRIAGTKANNFKDGVMTISRRGAEVAVRTAVNHSANMAHAEWASQNRDIVVGLQRVAILDRRTCSVCAGLDGGIVKTGNAPLPPGSREITEVGPVHGSCRCTMVPVLAGEAQAPQETYPEWLKRQPREVQEDVLGKTKAKLFKDGDLKIEEFTSPRGKTLTLDELSKARPEAFEKSGLNPDDF